MMGGVLMNTFYTIFQTAKITNKSHLHERPTKILYYTVNKNSFFVDFVKMVGKLKYIRIFDETDVTSKARNSFISYIYITIN